MKENKFDSKFRFVIVAAQRAKQLLKGAQPKIKTKYKSPIRIAEEEVKSGAVKYEILPFSREEGQEEEFVLVEPIPLETIEAEATEELEDQEEDFESEEETEEEEEEFEEELEESEEELEEEDE
ncbi:MAG: DNA-directed RNA polymerase subunit omega [Candidatus Aminicenantes bacterium]|nr:DNA-directed RNA polymerase subunit omega [Candidatus Aminicenantes bacterium]